VKSHGLKSVSRAGSELRKKSGALNGPFPIVAVGASAGGLEAYTEFFHALPDNTGMGFVLVQHLDPTHHSLLTEIIAKTTRMPVAEVKSGAKVKANYVYVIPPNSLMTVAGGVLKLTPRKPGPPHRGPRQQGDLAINFFMGSLALERRSGAIGIVLSGTGGDGTAGLERIKAEGGITFAQEPSSAKFDGMPRSAIDSGCVDYILPPRQIAQTLVEIHGHPYITLPEQRSETADSDFSAPLEKAFARVIEQLRRTGGVDFSQYKRNTIYRRALRRMMVLRIELLDEYAKYLRAHPEESHKLYDDVLIPVTRFFRDFEAFEALKTQVYPAVVKDKTNKGAIRMWAPGCSTGEETYSLAMTLLEFLGERASSFHIQIFGTDLNERVIQKARTGIYLESIAEEISLERMSRFFIKVDEGYRVNKAVRDLCVFARQNLAGDPPFSQMNVVVCRNLLIYMQSSLQKKVLPILHYALKPQGFLVLGSSESVTSFPDLFSAIDRKHKIYARKPIASRVHYDFAQTRYPSLLRQDFIGSASRPGHPVKEEVEVQAEADRLLLKSHTPAGVIVNGAMEVVQFRGRTSPYLEQSSGRPSVNLLKLARNGLDVELRTLIASATRKRAAVKREGIPFQYNRHHRVLNLSVSPLGDKSVRERRFFLVLFEDVTSRPTEAAARRKGKNGALPPSNKPESKRLTRELASTREALHSAIESEEALKEKFQSANEEILSANEELQSTNEELQTSKEELQSANEELNTLNSELQNRNSELHDLNNDISNLLNSTRIPVVMLDRHMRIRRFTPVANKLLKVAPSDIGRPLGDIRPNILEPDHQPVDFESKIAKVIDSLQQSVSEVKDLEGRWHSLSILPYRTQDNKIDGAVLALQDIDAIKAASEQLQKSSEFFRAITDTIREPLLVLDPQLRVVGANAPFLATFEVSREETVGRFLYDLGNRQWDIPLLRTLLEQVLPEKRKVTDFGLEWEFERLGLRTMLLNAQTLTQTPGDAPPMIMLAIEDITERWRTAANLRESEEHFRMVADNMSQLAWTCDELGNVTWYNQRWLDYTGMTFDAQEGWGWRKVQHPAHVDRVVEGVNRSREKGEVWEDIFPLRGKDGNYRWFLSRAVPIRDTEGNLVRWFGTNTDITERRLAEEALIKSERLAASGRLAATLAHEINNPLQAVTNLLTLLGQSPRLDLHDQEYARMAREELGRVTHLAQQSLAFYRESTSATAVSVEEIVENILQIFGKRIAARKIAVRKEYRSDGAIIVSHAGEIRQVFSNLLTNAMEAVPPGGNFVLRISKSIGWEKQPVVHGVRITLADSGCGIPAHQATRVFEPFFTTKGENGVGLGLWIAKGIADRLGGSIRMRSSVRPNRSGTCFSIFLPSRPPM